LLAAKKNRNNKNLLAMETTEARKACLLRRPQQLPHTLAAEMMAGQQKEERTVLPRKK
ncbi:unnamed protein product, partial [Sphenostylis stenocarpa]